MKNIRQVLLGIMFLLSAIPIATLAYTGQYPWDPIYVAPTQQTLNSQTEQSLKSQYGISTYYACYPCSNTDTSNPYTQTSCLSQTKYCLESKAIASTTQCSSGFIYSNGKCESICASADHVYYGGKCITRSDLCVIKYGEGSYTDGIVDPVDGKYACDCGSGYQWNSAGTACEKVAATTASTVATASVSIPEGAIIKTADNPDVYIVKYIGSKKFKRLILSPSVFKSYGHLKWEDLITVSQQTMDTFKTSYYVKAVGDMNMYQLSPQGDIGEKSLVVIDSEGYQLWGAMRTKGNSLFDYDAVYEINAVDRDSYVISNS